MMRGCHKLRRLMLPFLLVLLAMSLRSSTAQQQTVDCSVCGASDLVVGSPDTMLQDPFGDSQVSCGDIETLGQAGGYSSLECAAIQFSVFANCDCVSDTTTTTTDEPTASPVAAATTESPTVAATPTDAPSTTIVDATDAPTDPPATESPTAMPTAKATTMEPTVSPSAAVSQGTTATDAPTIQVTLPLDDLPSVSGRVVVSLQDVAGAMPITTIAAYEQQMTQFFADLLANESPPVRTVQATLLRQTFGAGRRRALVRRTLQSSSMSAAGPLETILEVTGRRDTLDGKNGTMDGLLVQTVNENADELVQDYLRNVTPAINQIYFKPVESVEAFEVPDEVMPTTAPTASPVADGGLGIGALVGIIVGGLFVVAVFMGVIWYTQVGKDKQMEEITGESEIKRRISERSLSVNADNDLGPTEKPLAASKPAAAALSRTAPAPQSVRKEEPAPVSEPDESEEEDDEEDIASDADEPSDEEVDPAPMAPLTAGKITKTITAPAGKLGIVIDTTLEGPVIHKVNVLSPLEGMLKAGDIIVAINDVDTKAMGSSAITALMIKTANQKRTLTVLTDG